MQFIKKGLKIYLFVYKEIKNANALLLWVLLISTLAAGVIPVITKYIMKVMISLLENEIDFNGFVLSVGLYALILFFQNIFSNFREYINSLSNHKFVYNIQSKLINKINKIEYKTFYSPDYQDDYNTVIQNSQFETTNLMFTTIQMSMLVVQLIITSVIVMKFNPIILFSLIVCSLPTILLNMENEKERVAVTEKSALFYRKNFYYFDIFTHIPFI